MARARPPARRLVSRWSEPSREATHGRLAACCAGWRRTRESPRTAVAATAHASEASAATSVVLPRLSGAGRPTKWTDLTRGRKRPRSVPGASAAGRHHSGSAAAARSTVACGLYSTGLLPARATHRPRLTRRRTAAATACLASLAASRLQTTLLTPLPLRQTKLPARSVDSPPSCRPAKTVEALPGGSACWQGACVAP